MNALGSGKRHSLFSGAILALFLARPAIAQTTCPAAAANAGDVLNTHWTPPLDRTLTPALGESTESLLTLRDALERIASEARIRLSYSSEVVPLDRRVCFASAGTVGSALSGLLDGTEVTAVAVANDHIVLTPKPAVERSAPVMAPSMSVLEKMVVTESAMPTAERRQTVNVRVIDGHQLARQNTNNLSAIFDGEVPGVWSWSQSPSSMMGSFASIRGASSFGLSYPKIYIDGIEVANPLLVTRFTADAIDRVEVIRGPQGSALYGTDAISGVVNIITRHEGVGAGGDHATLRTSAGVVESEFSRDVMAQNHSLSVVSGTTERSADLNVSVGTVGDFIPDGYSRDLLATGSTRVIRSRSTFSATGRFFAQQAGGSISPLLDTVSVFQSQKNGPQSIQEYTLGGTATFAPNDRWTHTFVAGVDGYRLSNVQVVGAPFASATDSALCAAEGDAARGTFRATSALRFGNDATGTTLTFSAEHGVFRGAMRSVPTMTTSSGHSALPGLQTEQAAVWQTSTGVTTQAAAALSNTWFASGGVRVERDSRLPGDKLAVLPMIGLAAVRDIGDFSVKLRAGYGEGIRPASTVTRPAISQIVYSTTQTLGAERQVGTEFGFDLGFRHALNLRVTRFDQLASGLIQQVSVAADANPISRRMRYELENVGEIVNRGWEMEGSLNVQRLTVSGTASLVSSRVARLAPDYNGDLMAGDRMLQVPARTAALNVSYNGRRWYTTIGASRAFDWINYDELGRARAYASGNYPLSSLTGPQLRDYWRRYDGALRLRATVSRDFRDMFTFEISGENLLNHQVNEPDNLTIIPGRTIMTGVRVRF